MAVIPRRQINPEVLTNFLKNNIEPLTDQIYGNRYRAAARLIDDTYLPCVVFQSRKAQVDLALRRFDQLRNQDDQYRAVVEVFAAGGSRISDYEIKAVEPSPFAWPLEILATIHGETVMSWTAFVAEMKDGTKHSYGTSFRSEFFNLPHGYSYADIAKIHSGMVYSQELGLREFSMELQKEIQPYREKPFFTCYLKDLSDAI
jgi:hypothetical protein